MCALNVLNKNEQNFKTNNKTETKIVLKGLFAFPLTVKGEKSRLRGTCVRVYFKYVRFRFVRKEY